MNSHVLWNINLNFKMLFPGMMLNKENKTTIEYRNPSKNAYAFWDIQTPSGFVVSVMFEHFEINGDWDNYMFFAIGDNEDQFSASTNSCRSWTPITEEGRFQSKYMYTNFTSRSSSLRLIFSSFTAKAIFSIKLQVQKSKGIHIRIFRHDFNCLFFKEEFMFSLSESWYI